MTTHAPKTGIQYGKHGQCTATANSTGNRCLRPAMGPHQKCRFHGGASTGPSDASSLEGNQHAKGNSGGGAPVNNTNAQKSGAFANWMRTYERLDGDQREFVDRVETESIERSREHAPDLDEDRRERLAREYGTLFVLEWRALADEFERGFGIEETVELPDGGEHRRMKANPCSVQGHRLSSRQRNIAKELCILPRYQD